MYNRWCTLEGDGKEPLVSSPSPSCLTRDPPTPPFVSLFYFFLRLVNSDFSSLVNYGCSIFATWSSGERAEGKTWSRSRLGRAGDEARELLPWTAGPGAQKNFDPEHPLARDSKGRSLALLLYSCLIQSVSCRPPSHYVSRTHCRSPAVPHARALACMSVMVEVVKGAKFLHEVH